MNKLYPLCFLLFSLIVTPVKANPEVPDCEVLRYFTYCDVRDGKLTRTDTMAIQINNRSGEDYCKIEIPFSKGNPITHFAAWIEDTNGIVVRQLKRQEYVDISSIADYSLYEDDYIRKFTLKHNNYPYRIYYTYRIVFRQFLNIADWYPVLDSDIPTHHAMLVFNYPENYRFNVYEKNITSPEIIESAAGITRY